jgi:uncharacterized protein YijF (DUF1287 family)
MKKTSHREKNNYKTKRKRSLPRLLITWIAGLALLAAAGYGAYQGARYFGLITPGYYTAKDFNIEIIRSSVDFNQNGVDDYTDFVRGARKDAEKRPQYDPAYFAGGYPPEDIGVCTDLVWRAFKHAGYNLKEMVDKDIANNIELYPNVGGQADPNIDFRRVPNLLVFFSRYGQTLTTDVKQISEWQPGDIVVYGTTHIGIVSDKRNKEGVPYLLHNGGQPVREEDGLEWGSISGHFRFDASKVPPEYLIAYAD